MKSETMNKNMKKGSFTSGIKFVSFGHGEKIVFLLDGGPGNLVDLGSKSYYKALKPLLDKGFTFYVTTRKSNLPDIYPVSEMAKDIINVIEEDFSGKIHGILGLSYGGLLIQEIAYQRPDISEKYILWGSAYKVTPEGAKNDQDYAKYMSERRYAKAFSGMMEHFSASQPLNNLMVVVMRLFGGFLKSSIEKEASPTFNHDIVVEAKNESIFNSEDILPKIQVPFLIIGGTHDFFFPIEYMEKTAELIPKSQLKLIEGAGHAGLLSKKAILWIENYL